MRERGGREADKDTRAQDFTMMTMFGARVRSFDEHLRLLRLADERFTLKQYGESGPAGSGMYTVLSVYLGHV